MGIDIYLNGYDVYLERSAIAKAAFNEAVSNRDRHERGSHLALAAQVLVDVAAEEMWSGKYGYLRSSYNSGGFFNVLEEIFGFDVGGYLFPGQWEQPVPLDGLLDRVRALEATALIAMQNSTLDLPWIGIFTQVTGQTAPMPHPSRTRGEEFGKLVRSMLESQSELTLDPTREIKPRLSGEHVWYLTDGMKNLREFAELAEETKGSYADISY